MLNLLRHDCGACHGYTLSGGLGPPLRPQDLEGADTDALVDTILNGVPGTAMPGWKQELSEDEVRWLVSQLKKGLP